MNPEFLLSEPQEEVPTEPANLEDLLEDQEGQSKSLDLRDPFGITLHQGYVNYNVTQVQVHVFYCQMHRTITGSDWALKFLGQDNAK